MRGLEIYDRLPKAMRIALLLNPTGLPAILALRRYRDVGVQDVQALGSLLKTSATILGAVSPLLPEFAPVAAGLGASGAVVGLGVDSLKDAANGRIVAAQAKAAQEAAAQNTTVTSTEHLTTQTDTTTSTADMAPVAAWQTTSTAELSPTTTVTSTKASETNAAITQMVEAEA